jgi:hypothetical protein
VSDDLDDDFATVPTHRVVVIRLVRGESRRTIAADLGLELHQVHEHVAQAVREWSGAAGTRRERYALLHMQLDELVGRTFAALDSELGYDPAPLLAVLVDASKLRAGLLTGETPRREQEAATTPTERNAP